MSDVDRMIQRLQQRIDARLVATRTALEAWGEESTQFMQQSAPWQDQTGEARRRLGWVKRHPRRLRDGARIALIHGAKHGKWLELAHVSRFQVMQTTMAVKGPEMAARLKEIWQ